MVVTLITVSVFFILKNSRSGNSAVYSPRKITVLLDWFPNTNHTGLYVANEKGYFRDENLEVSILQPGEGENTQAVASGKAEFGVSSEEAVIQARAEKIPLVSIAAVIQHNTSGFASLASGNIKNVRDFEGKRYGGWGSPIEEAILQAVMTEAQADYSKVKNITIGETDFFKTIGKDSDFQWIFYGWDGVEAERRNIPLNIIMVKDVNPVLDYYTPVIITNEEHVQNKKEVVRAFMKAVARGYEFSINNPAEAAEILIKMVPESNQELVRKSQEWISRQYQSDSPRWGIQKTEVWQRYTDWLTDHRLIKEKPDTKLSFTNEFLP